MKNPFLIGKSVYLRAPEPGDETVIALSENHPEPRENLFYALPTGTVEQKERLVREQADPHILIMIICLKHNDQIIGKTGFYRIDWVGRMAVYYIAIAESSNWQKGYGSEVTGLMMDYAFNTLNLNRVQLHVFKGNAAAVKVYKNTGFQIEGTLREAMYHNGRYGDFYVMGLLRRDYSKLQSSKPES